MSFPTPDDLLNPPRVARGIEDRLGIIAVRLRTAAHRRQPFPWQIAYSQLNMRDGLNTDDLMGDITERLREAGWTNLRTDGAVLEVDNPAKDPTDSAETPPEIALAGTVPLYAWIPRRFESVSEFHYENHRGIVAKRRVIALGVWFGSTRHHPEEQYLLRAYDLDRNAWRDFPLRNFYTTKRLRDRALYAELWERLCDDLGLEGDARDPTKSAQRFAEVFCSCVNRDSRAALAAALTTPEDEA